MAGGVNLYAYAGNNPVSFSDPYGLDCQPHDYACQIFKAGMTVLGGISGGISGAVGGGAVGTALAPGPGTVVGAGVLGVAGTMAGATAAGALAEGWWSKVFYSDDTGPGGEKKPSSAGKMQQEVSRGQAPRSVDRVDKGRAFREQDNVHFKDGHALNRDGSWKHGGRNLSNAEKDWLNGHGWKLPGD